MKRISIPRKEYGLERFEELLKFSDKQLEKIHNKIEKILDKEYRLKKVTLKRLSLYKQLLEDIERLLDPFERSGIISCLPKKPMTEQEREQLKKEIEENKRFNLLHSRPFSEYGMHIHITLPSQSVKFTDNKRSMKYAASESQR